MSARKIPMRMCIACRQMKTKTELVRTVKTPDGAVVPFAGNKVNGRGAYLCRDAACVLKAEKTGALSRALETEIDKSVYDELKKGCEERD